MWSDINQPTPAQEEPGHGKEHDPGKKVDEDVHVITYRFAALPLLGIFVLAAGAPGFIAGQRFGRSTVWPPSVPSWPPLYVPPVFKHIHYHILLYVLSS
jgi:hypothetical protein